MAFLQTHSPQVKGDPGLGTAVKSSAYRWLSQSHMPSSCAGLVLQS